MIKEGDYKMSYELKNIFKLQIIQTIRIKFQKKIKINYFEFENCKIILENNKKFLITKDDQIFCLNN